MRDESLVEPFAVQEIFVDGFTDHAVHNGVMSCVGYRLQPPSRENSDALKVVVIRLVWPAITTEEGIADARRAETVAPRVSKVDRHRRH